MPIANSHTLHPTNQQRLSTLTFELSRNISFITSTITIHVQLASLAQSSAIADLPNGLLASNPLPLHSRLHSAAEVIFSKQKSHYVFHSKTLKPFLRRVKILSTTTSKQKSLGLWLSDPFSFPIYIQTLVTISHLTDLNYVHVCECVCSLYIVQILHMS